MKERVKSRRVEWRGEENLDLAIFIETSYPVFQDTGNRVADFMLISQKLWAVQWVWPN